MFIVPEYVSEWFLKLREENTRGTLPYFKNRETSEVSEWFESLPYSRRVVYKFLKEGKKEFDIILCSVCKKPLSETQILEGGTCCSRSCAMYVINNSESVKEKKKQTCLKHYGVENPSYSVELRKKADETNLKKYGVKNVFSSEIIKEKIRQTNLQKYGVENASQSDVVKEKRNNTCFEKYGTANIQDLDWIKEKKRQTSLKNYGTDSPLQNKEFRESIKKRHHEQYGCDYPAQRKEFIEKMKRTYRIKNWDSFVNSLKSRMLQPLFGKEIYVNANFKNFEFKCLLCGTKFYYSDTRALHIHCPHCINTARSVKEHQFLDFLKEIYHGEIIENDRSVLGRKELDAYIPQKNLAFEFNGNYWHSIVKKENFYHQQKSIECRKRGIRLIHIFEWEWETKRDKIINLVKSALGIFEKKIYARECTVKNIDSNTYKDFLEKNHLHGAINSSMRFGLFFNGELVSVMGFGKSRFGKDEMELHRYCVKGTYCVVGGFSKLLKHSGVKNCISFVDFAHFDGNGYECIGFKEIALTPPSYIYQKYTTIYSRFMCQKHKLKTLLGEAFDDSLTEKENMIKEGFQMIYDCGNLKYCYGENEHE